MARYARILLSLAILAALYWGLGGFGGSAGEPEPADEPAAAGFETGAAGSLAGADVVSAAASGGPDDGPSFGYPLDGPGYDRLDTVTTLATLGEWETVTIERGESFYVALRRVGLDHQTIMAAVDACKPHTNLRRVQRGDTFLIAREGESGLRALRFDVDAESYVLLQREEPTVDEAIADAATTEHLDSPTMTAEVRRYPVERLVRAARGEIRTNLFDALKEKGADPSLADQLAEILGWNIDFFRDLRVGDDFVVVYAEYVNGEQKVRDPEVLAVHFTNKGETRKAYRWENELGLPAYYDAEGGSLERQFLRAPLKFSRISSNFSYRRLHPVLKRYRPHWGVDYVAPVGTPVFATADGKIIERTRNRGSGNFVGVRHGNGYETYYLHLSRFAKGQQVGQRVKQGTVIGYVGNTGWSTSAHLDYRIKKNGKWVNPRKLSLPPADPVGEDRLPRYMTRVAELETLIGSVPEDTSTLVLQRSESEPFDSTFDGAGAASTR